MSRPLQPGDLCWIIDSENADQGCSLPSAQCILKHRYSPGETIIVRGLPMFLNEEAWHVNLSGGHTCAVSRSYLVRIDGNPDAEIDKIKRQEPESAHG